MNCPGHCLIYASESRSYRDLPLRLADFGVLHRNELSGALTGLTRVVRFQQDDAHIFCTEAQLGEEIRRCLDFLHRVYGLFGFKFEMKLSTRPDKSMGEDALWEKAEAALRASLDSCTLVQPSEQGPRYQINPKDGAFYGPKIDVDVTDALGRKHQCATIQLDFQLPRRFGLSYVAEDGQKHIPVMIHRAILGSVERMFAILLEHYGGKWPLWLSPRQVVVLPIASEYSSYAQKIVSEITAAGFHCDLDDGKETLQKRVRQASILQYNYVLVVGKAEQAAGTVKVRSRESPQQQTDHALSEFLRDLQAQLPHPACLAAGAPTLPSTATTPSAPQQAKSQ
jgi:threonyl-tRNA synthetase